MPEARVSSRVRTARSRPGGQQPLRSQHRRHIHQGVEPHANAAQQHQLRRQRHGGCDELRQKRQKKQRGLDVQGLDQNAFAQGPCRALRLHTRQHKGIRLAPQQAHAQVDQIGRAPGISTGQTPAPTRPPAATNPGPPPAHAASRRYQCQCTRPAPQSGHRPPCAPPHRRCRGQA